MVLLLLLVGVVAAAMAGCIHLLDIQNSYTVPPAAPAACAHDHRHAGDAEPATPTAPEGMKPERKR